MNLFLTMKDVEWHWTEHQEQAFNKLKQLVTEAPVLKYFEPTEELTLQRDAFDTGLGAVLAQRQGMRKLRGSYWQWFSGSRSFTSTHMAAQSLSNQITSP